MKKFVLAMFLIYGCTSSNPVVVTDFSDDPAEAHKSANDFADKVGAVLKMKYPARVTNIRVRVTKEDGDYVFHWQCDIEKTTIDKAQYYFDHRGTFLLGNTKDDAYNRVEKELHDSRKVQNMIDDFRDYYGGYIMPTNFVKTEFTQDQNRYWCLREFFCAGPK